MRTLVPITCGFMLGLALGVGQPQAGWTLPCALGWLGLASALATSAARAVPRAWLRLVPTLLVLAAASAGRAMGTHAALPVELPPAGTARLIARVQAVSYGEAGRARSRVTVLSGARLSDAAAIPRGTVLNVGPFPLPAGARVRLLATIHPNVPFRNPSPHPALPNAHPARGFAQLAGPNAFSVLQRSWSASWLDALRSRTRQRLERTLPRDAAAVARTLLLGDAHALDPDEVANVRGAGLAHVFAVSGMHVTLLAGLLMLGLKRALLSVRPLATRWDVPRLAAGLGVPLALGVSAFTGGAPSAWRAGATTALAWLLVALGRRPDRASITAGACLCFAAAAPGEALGPSFLLSIAATAAIVTARPKAGASLGEALAQVASLTARTAFATSPITWWAFGSLPVVGIASNLWLLPLGSLLLLLTAAHASVAWLLPPLARFSAPGLTAAARAFLGGCAAFSALDPHWQLPPLSVMQGAALACAACVVLLARTARARVWALVACLVVCLYGEWALRQREQPRDQLRVSYLDVGQGDCALVDFPDGRCMLIDAGGNPQGGPDPGARALVPLLRARRRDHLDVVVLTHPHPDHYGGLRAVLGSVRVDELWDSGQSALEADPGSRSPALALVQRAKSNGTRVLRPKQLCGRARRFGTARVQVLWPCPAVDAGYGPNDNSIVLRIDYHGRSALFTGDIEAHAEAQLLERAAPLRADVLKVAHHGSATSSSEAFLAAVAPRLAVISAGAVNHFGHPNPQVVERLRRRARVLDIGRTGGRIVTLGEGPLRVEP